MKTNAKEPQPLLSVIIVSWNTRDLIAACLATVAQEMALLASEWHQQNAERDHGTRAPTGSELVEVIVVDNASSDGSVAMMRRDFPWVRLLVNRENIGFAGGNNQALSHCRGHYVLLLNSDTTLLPGAFCRLLDFMDKEPTVGIAGSRYLNPDGSLQISCYPAPTVSRELWRLFHLDKLHAYGTYPMHEWSIQRPRPVEVVQGAALLLRRELALRLGLFDPDYFMYTEEVDLCRRVRQAGWQIYWVPQSTIVHYGGQSTRQVAEAMFLQLYRSKILYFRKHHGAVATLLYKVVLLCATLARLLLTPLAWVQAPQRRQQSLTLASHYRQLFAALPTM